MPTNGGIHPICENIAKKLLKVIPFLKVQETISKLDALKNYLTCARVTGGSLVNMSKVNGNAK